LHDAPLHHPALTGCLQKLLSKQRPPSNTSLSRVVVVVAGLVVVMLAVAVVVLVDLELPQD